MKRLTLVVDERELSTIQAALLLLQEQVNALPEDLADMLSGHGPAMTEKEIGKLSHRLAFGQNKLGLVDGARMAGRLVEVDRSPSATMALK